MGDWVLATVVVSIVALLMGLLNLSLWSARRGAYRPQVRIEAASIAMAKDAPDSPHPGFEAVRLRIVNVGSSPVTLESLGFREKVTGRLRSSEEWAMQFPLGLEPRSCKELVVPHAQVQRLCMEGPLSAVLGISVRAAVESNWVR